MKDKDIYLGLELVLTFFLLILVIFLTRIILPFRIKQYLIIALCCGFSFSWFSRNRAGREIRYFTTAATIGVFGWLVYSILNSSFFYKEVIVICLKAAFLLEVILSFGSCTSPFLSYMQALSVPLFMSHPLFIKDYSAPFAALTLGYFFCWFAVFKVKFYGLLGPGRQKKFAKFNSVYLSVILFLISIFTAWLFFSHVPLGKIKKGGFLPQTGSGLETGLDDLEKEYYDLRDSVQKKTIDLIPGFQTTGEQHEVLELLNKLINESPYMILAEKAKSGLVSRLKSPGPGLEKKDTEELTILLNRYLDKKAAFNLRKTEEDIKDSLRNNRSTIKDTISILFRVTKTLYSNSYKEASKYENEIKRAIDNSSLNGQAKKELKELSGQLKDWKAFEMYRQKLVSLSNKIGSLDERLKEDTAGLLSEIEDAQRLSELKEAVAKARRLKEANPALPEDIVKGMEEASDLKSGILLSQGGSLLKEKLEQAGLPEDKVGALEEKIEAIKDTRNSRQIPEDLSELQETMEASGVDISQETKELTDLKTYLLAQEKEAEDLARLQAKIAAEEKSQALARAYWLRLAIFILAVILILSILILPPVFYFLTEKRKNELKFSLSKNPRAFIVGLYENMRRILGFFNLDYEGFLAPIYYAELVREKYSIRDNLFLRFTSRFEEAKYSRHVLDADAALSALDDYNNFLQTLFSRYNRVSLFAKYCLALVRRTPFFISKK
jgi:hypothetical protein